MALLINGDFHDAASGAAINSIYGRLTVGLHATGNSIDVSVAVYKNKAAYQAGRAPIVIEEAANYQWQKTFPVAGSGEQNVAKAHEFMAGHYESEEGGSLTVTQDL